jgi:MFS family permease
MTFTALAPEGWLPRQGHPILVRWGLVFVPFVTGYFLSYLYRTITALISEGLARDLDLGPADLGLLASMYFLAFGLVQLPLGVWLDRLGPRRVQAVLLAIAAAGALMFALAGSFATLMLARCLIGLGVAGGLMAGLKAIVLWFPPDRIALANGWFVMVGALGAVTATQPAELLLAPLGWRGLFILLAALTALAALLVLVLVPERDGPAASGVAAVSISAIYCDRRFWRLAPLSATVIGSAWALQGLWAAPWLRDVEGLSRAATVNALLLMACALAAGAFVLGSTAHRLRRTGIGQPALLAFASALSVLAQFALVMRWTVPPLVPWLVIAALGAATVLSYAILADTFPKAVSGRANGALNLLHVAVAFAVQAGIGRIVELWPPTDGRPPLAAYQAAFSVNLALQAIALVWFVVAAPWTRATVYSARPTVLPAGAGAGPRPPPIPYEAALAIWVERVEAARVQRLWWRRAAIVSLCLLLMISTIVALRGMTTSIVHVVAMGVRP